MAEIDLWKFVGSGLRDRRIRAGFTIEELATLVGISGDKLLAFEADTRGMELETLVTICSALGEDLLKLFGEYPLSNQDRNSGDIVKRWEMSLP